MGQGKSDPAGNEGKGGAYLYARDNPMFVCLFVCFGSSTSG